MNLCSGQSVICTLQVCVNFLYLTGTTGGRDKVHQFATKH